LLVTAAVALIVFAAVVTAAKYFPIQKETTGAAPAQTPVDQKSPERSDRIEPKRSP
jgi:hypothetical protein